jgi:hypothetical protein
MTLCHREAGKSRRRRSAKLSICLRSPSNLAAKVMEMKLHRLRDVRSDYALRKQHGQERTTSQHPKDSRVFACNQYLELGPAHACEPFFGLFHFLDKDAQSSSAKTGLLPAVHCCGRDCFYSSPVAKLAPTDRSCHWQDKCFASQWARAILPSPESPTRVGNVQDVHAEPQEAL